jgi:hypothetical protein
MPMNFPLLEMDQINPFAAGLQRGQQQYQLSMLNKANLQKALLENKMQEYKNKMESYLEPNYQTLAQSQVDLAKLAPKEHEQKMAEIAQLMQYNPQRWQSEMNLQGAQTGKLNKETSWYDREAAAKIKAEEAQAGLHGAESQVKKMMVDYLRGGEGGAAGQGGTGGIGGIAQSSSGSGQSIYGVDVPRPTKEDIMNKMLFGIDTYAARSQGAQDQIKNETKAFNEKVAQATQESQSAASMKDAVNVFNNAYKQATFKGSTLGGYPSTGIGTVIGDFSAEQTLDMAANQMLPAAISQIKNAMGDGKFSNLDMMQASKLKFYRGMDRDTLNTQTDWVNAVESRSQEKAKFYGRLRNPAYNIDSTTADLLWTNYQNNQHLISKDGKSVLNENLNKWPVYTTPAAIQSIKESGVYNPPKSVLKAVWMQLPSGDIVPIAPNKTAEAIKKLNARPV